MSMSRLDHLYRRLLLTKFFTRGWGKPDNLKRLFAFRKILSNRETCQHLVAADYPINIDREYKDGDCRILEGHFLSPFVHHLPGIMPKEVETASFQVILPAQWRHPTLKPVCIHLAGTGDHYFWRRRLLTARPLLKEAGIASIILENPYYGTRKPKQQLRSSLHNVSDLFVMGGALVLESLALLHWCEREGWGPLGLSGISMGGHMASLAATNWTKPIPLIPCLSWSTASCVFTQGVMSGAIPWKTLQEQFFENSVYQDEIRKLIISPEDNRRRAYDMGQQFVKDYSQDIEEVESIHKHVKQQKSHSNISPDTFQPVETRQNVSDNTTTGSNAAAVNYSSTCDKIEHANAVGDNVINKNVNNNAQPVDGRSGQVIGSVTKSSLTRDEYIARVHVHSTTQSFSDEEGVQATTYASGFEPARGIVSSVPSGSGNSPLASSISSTSRVPPAPLSMPSSTPPLQNQPPLSSSSSSLLSDTSTSSAKQQKNIKKDTQPLTLNYAKTKQAQQLPRASLLTEAKGLSLKHAIAKSKLIISRQPSHVLPTNEEQLKSLQQEALDFMRGVMDECTHLGNFSVPVDPELIIIVSARQDAYVPKDGVLGLDQLWPGCEVRYVDQGHVGAVLLHQSVFRKAIVDAFDRQIQKYYQNPGSEPSEQRSVKSLS